MILVTGATGHIGNVLVRRLVERGDRVRVLLWRGEDALPLEGLDVEQVSGDVLDLESLLGALAGVDLVYHLAGMVSIMPGANDLVRRVNVEGTLNVIVAALQTGVGRLVYTSSIHALLRAPHGVEITEALPYDPHNPVGAYDRSKAEATLKVLAAARHGLDAVIVCPTGVIGPYDFRLSEMGQLIYDCARCKPQLYIDGAYDFVDVRDVADGLILAGERGLAGESYILSGEQLTVRNLLEAVWELSGRPFMRLKIPLVLARLGACFTPYYYRLARVTPRFTPYSLATLQSNSQISSAKARRDLGYHPRPLRESLSDTLEWWCRQGKIPSISP